MKLLCGKVDYSCQLILANAQHCVYNVGQDGFDIYEKAITAKQDKKNLRNWKFQNTTERNAFCNNNDEINYLLLCNISEF